MEWHSGQYTEYRGWIIIDTGWKYIAISPTGERQEAKFYLDDILKKIET